MKPTLLMMMAWGAILGGCTATEDDVAQAEFEESYALLEQQYPQSTGDSCEALGFWSDLGADALHSGFSLGVEGDAVLGPVTGFGGYDIVWDLYHQQLTVSKYAGTGIAVPELGVGVETYACVGFGFTHGVSDWDGYFETATAEIGLPFLEKFAHLDAAGFVSAERDDQGELQPLIPPDGVYGFTFGASLGIGIDLVPSPITGDVTVGLWTPHKTAIAHFYDELRKKRIFGLRRLAVRLVDDETGETCPADWPAEDTERDCVIAFGKADATPARRAIDVAYAICSMSHGCTVPLAFQMATTALAIGSYRTYGHDVAQDCAEVE